MLYVGTDCSGC